MFYLSSPHIHIHKFYSTVKPYFDPNYGEDVILNWNKSTTLKFKVYGSPKKEIWGRVTQTKLTTPASKLTTPDAKHKFCIKKPELASGKTGIECNVVIKRTNAGHSGYWYLISWYGESPDDKATSRRNVIDKSKTYFDITQEQRPLTYNYFRTSILDHDPMDNHPEYTIPLPLTKFYPSRARCTRHLIVFYQMNMHVPLYLPKGPNIGQFSSNIL